MTDQSKAQHATIREYVVLVQRDANDVGEDRETWAFVGRATAGTDTAAIAIAEPNPQDGETYIAVPARSWRPRTRTVKTVTRESWS